MESLSRRSFLAASVAAIGGAAIPGVPAAGEPPAAPAAPPGPLPVAPLGRTGRVLPRLGFGGYPISQASSDDEAVKVVRRAIDLGVRYFDTAPSYGSGRSERRIGRAIAESGLDRGEFFVATKTLHRQGDAARRDVEGSLQRLGLQYIDSLSVHEVHDDVESLFGPGAVLEALEKTRQEGLIRHIGITGHRNPRYLVRALERYDGFATALVPVNPLDKKHLSFINEFVPRAAERGVAVVAMKVFAGGSLLAEGRFRAAELIRYALSQPHVAIAEPGCETVAHVEEAYAAAVGFEVLSPDAQSKLERRAGEHLGKKSEWYKEEKGTEGQRD